MFRSYISREERKEADGKLGKLMVEGLLLGGSGLGVLALIFEIAADAFSVAAYQTLLAIDGAGGYHRIAIYAFIVLSVLLFLGIVPAYKAGAYLRPNAGGSGPLVEAIGPERMRWLSWIGTSLFFLDAILTIIISSISAADATMLIFPEFASYRILLAEVFAFFIMGVLVLLGPKRAVPLFLIGGGAFTIFTLFALTMVTTAAVGNPEWGFLVDGIVSRLESNGVVEHVVRATGEAPALLSGAFLGLFFRSMSSAMLGFSGYEVIPASGKHAARPKWKVINTALTLAAVFLIGTGVMQLNAASRWNIPATEGYSTLLIEYEIVAAQMFGRGVEEADVTPTFEDREEALRVIELRETEDALHSEVAPNISETNPVDEVAQGIATARGLENAMAGTFGSTFLLLAALLLAIILLLAQGGGYIGGAAVAANAARLGRLPGFFADDRIGIAVIWGISAIVIPIVRTVTVVESYYAFGFVSAFVITSTTVFFVRDDALRERGIESGSAEARSLKFAGLRGMIASYIMMIVLITQKSEALGVIVVAGALITLFQIYVARGGLRNPNFVPSTHNNPPGTVDPVYEIGEERAHDQARQRGVVEAVNQLLHEGTLFKFNVPPRRIRRLVSYLHNVDYDLFVDEDDHHERIEEPNLALEATYQAALSEKDHIARHIEDYSHFGIFMFIHNYHINWVSPEHGRDPAMVQRAMLDILFPLTDPEEIWKEYCSFKPVRQPEEIWQFSLQRYLWAKDQWPNLSDRITTIWTLQDFNLLPDDIDIQTIISVAGGAKRMMINIHPDGSSDTVEVEMDGDAALDSDT